LSWRVPLMVALLDDGCRSPGRSLRPTPSASRFAFADPCLDHVYGQSGKVGRNVVEALCAFGGLIEELMALKRDQHRFTKGGEARHRKTPDFLQRSLGCRTAANRNLSVRNVAQV
jgi:hypothetical protein